MSKNRKKIKCDEKKRSDGEKYKTILRINATPNASIINDISGDDELTNKNTIGELIKKCEEEGVFDHPDSYGQRKARELEKINRKLKVKGIFDWLFGGKK